MDLLTTLTQVQCMHGAPGRVSAPANGHADAVGGRLLVDSDVHQMLAPCPFMRGTQSSPCARISWKAGATRVTLGGKAALTKASVGTCYAADGSPQGLAVIGGGQSRVSGT